MRAHTKSAFLLLAVLALGILIGALVNGAMVNHRMRRLAELRTGPGLAMFMERGVQPASEEQRRRVREILDEAAPKYAEIFARAREETRILSDSIMGELSGVLSEEQMEELRRHLELRRRPPPGDPGRRGPPGPRRRPPPGERSAEEGSPPPPSP